MPERKSTSPTLDRALLDEARTLGVSLSRTTEALIGEATRKADAAHRKDGTREAFGACGRNVAENGILLLKLRQF